ncbi:hypothetical protein [Clostridium perfringens]|uniref:hypothetical protein n=1 Tax=Clostridium perfringens TaxID=1502 RepID=UPI000DD03207|nr:hypothetical protein [Clostridium perfringens]
MQQELIRKKIIEFLQWNDKNGYYTDERCDLEEVPRMTYKESINYKKNKLSIHAILSLLSLANNPIFKIKKQVFISFI